jgi:hypothetical protein
MILYIALCIVILFLMGSLYMVNTVSNTLMRERDQVVAQLRNLDQDYRNDTNGFNVEVTKLTADRDARKQEVIRLTNKLIEVQNRADLVESDAAQRMEEFKKHPTIACMTDGQVSILAEMLAIHLRQILESKKEWVN